MKQLVTTSGLREELDSRNKGSLGMVPTMGALHEGHLSLVRQSVKENETTVVSIFVNPTQFNDTRDLQKYPRTIESDMAMLSGILRPDDIIFTPEAADIYSNEKIPDIDLGRLDKIMEGEHRPGHFIGVVRIVSILFDLCHPDNAYFGRKDFQQLAVIKTLVRQTGLKTRIIECPIIREPNGLAMSSRNSRLSKDMRNKAGIIYKTLSRYNNVDSPENINDLKKKVISEINAVKGFEVEYFEIVEDSELKPLENVSEISSDNTYTGCIAVFAGEVRLIDNIKFSFPFAKG